MKSLWSAPVTIEQIQATGLGTMIENCGIQFCDLGPDFLVARMPVESKNKQPAGILHGGANVVLAETLASIASNLVVNRAEAQCVGLEINANHIRSASSGWVVGVSRPLHVGKTTQVWEVKIYLETNKGEFNISGEKEFSLSCVSRVTMAVLSKAK
jgi:1,4-dihydroxy-2-naphthoyl-CoA hydrolase